jgi:hypothetical protein
VDRVEVLLDARDAAVAAARDHAGPERGPAAAVLDDVHRVLDEEAGPEGVDGAVVVGAAAMERVAVRERREVLLARLLGAGEVDP